MLSKKKLNEIRLKSKKCPMLKVDELKFLESSEEINKHEQLKMLKAEKTSFNP